MLEPVEAPEPASVILTPESGDPLWREKAYRLAVNVLETAWQDSQVLARYWNTRSVADQLYRAAGSVAANYAEGYSRSSGRDRVRMLEYALGSARECRLWYRAGRHRLPSARVESQINELNQICRLLLAVIPRERSRLIR